MREFNDRGGRGGGGFRRDFDRDRPREPREEFDAKCSACGVECKVPFRPTEGREVFCRDCHRKRRFAA